MGRYLSDDELIATINHSSQPYIIVEGPDDAMVYRWILDEIDCAGLMEPRTGCDGVNSLISRRNEIVNPNVIFIIDKDTLVYSNRTPIDNNVIYTEGYSIENDLYQGKTFEKHYFKKDDKFLFEKSLNEFNGKEFDFTKLPENILSKDYLLDTSKLTDYKEPSQNSIEYLRKGYDLLLRGHSLFHLVRMIVGRKERTIKYSQKQLYDMCYCLKSDSIKHMQEKIKESFS